MRKTLLLATTLAPLLAPPADARHLPADPSSVAATAAPAADGPAAASQVGAEGHPGFDRLVVPVAQHGGHRVTRHGNTWVVLRPRTDDRPLDVGPLPRNVLSVVAGTTGTGAPTAEVTVLPGARVHYSFGDGVVTLDIADPPGTRVAGVPPLPATAQAVAARAALASGTPLRMPTGRDRPVAIVPMVAPPAPVVRDAAAASAPPATPAPATPASAMPVPAASAPGAVAIERADNAAGPGILLRTGADVGLAAFRAGGDMLVVLDAAIVFQAPGAGLNPAFAAMSSRRTQDATVIRIPLAAPGAIRLARDARGWLVTLAPPPNGIAGIVPRLVEEGSGAARMRLPASAPSRVVTTVDPRTGDRILVGTQVTPGEAVQSERLEVQFDLLATLQGVAVLPLSDDIRLQREALGFALVAGPHAGGSIISGIDPQDPAAPPAAPLSRLFDIPGDTTPVLIRKLVEQVDAAAGAPALARSAPRLRLAATMVALGIGVEAQSVLDVAAAEDPELGNTPRFEGLRAAASLLAHRFDEADKLADPRLGGTIEIDLWRALLQVAREQATERDASSLAAGLPLLTAYPPTLRERLLPDALEAMALHGQAPAAQAMLQTLPDQRELDLARGMAFEMTGHPVDALRAYDRAAAGADRLPRYKALVRAVELRLAGGKLDAKAAADAMDGALFGWRGARQELPLRIRIAQLRRQTGQWRDAMTVLRDGRAAFPDDRAQIDAEVAATLGALLSGDTARRLPPSEFVALYDQNQDLMQSMPWAAPLATRLVDHLVELGLLGRAEPIMARLVARTAEPVSRATLGARLAALRMARDDPAGAIAALADTAAAAAAAPATAPARQLLYARAEAARGNKDLALSMLGSLDSAEADEARADIYAARHDWTGAIAALGALERKRIPAADNGAAASGAAGSLTAPQQAVVMRLAEAAALGSDNATLARVAAAYGSAMEKSDSAALFRLVTSAPVRGTKDLPRAFAEIELARRLRAGLGPNAKP